MRGWWDSTLSLVSASLRYDIDTFVAYGIFSQVSRENNKKLWLNMFLCGIEQRQLPGWLSWQFYLLMCHNYKQLCLS